MGYNKVTQMKVIGFSKSRQYKYKLNDKTVGFQEKLVKSKYLKLKRCSTAVVFKMGSVTPVGSWEGFRQNVDSYSAGKVETNLCLHVQNLL